MSRCNARDNDARFKRKAACTHSQELRGCTRLKGQFKSLKRLAFACVFWYFRPWLLPFIFLTTIHYQCNWIRPLKGVARFFCSFPSMNAFSVRLLLGSSSVAAPGSVEEEDHARQVRVVSRITPAPEMLSCCKNVFCDVD